MNKLLILDGNSVLHRAYYALPEWRNRSGEATSGVYGFMSMLLKVIEELAPTHLAVAFDDPSPTFRHLAYVGYQTQREKDRQVSEDIWGQVEKLKDILGRLGVAVYQVPGFEADDVIGTLCQKIKNQKSKIKSEVVIVTGDRDLMQLVNPKVKLYMPQKGLTDAVLVGEKEVVDRLGIKPNQVVDYKGLVGDPSDNYPGVSGIGPKTAIELLGKFGTFNNLYHQITNHKSSREAGSRSAGQITNKISNSNLQKLVSGYQGGVLSRQLAAIKTDVPISWEPTQTESPSSDRLLQLFKELGYKSLIKRVGGEEDENSANPRLFE